MMRPPPLWGIRHVAINVVDLLAAEAFWVHVMGYAVEWRPDADNVYLCSGSDNLALHRRPVGSESRLDHIGLAVPAADDVDQWASYLAAQGVALVAVPKGHRDGSRSLYFRDPNGILVQIVHHAPLSK